MPPPKDPEKYALWLERQRAAKLGKPHKFKNPRLRNERISKAKTGKPRPDMRGDRNPMRRPEIAAKLTGERHPHYQEVPNYGSAHNRLIRKRGRAKEHACALCQKTARCWALIAGRATHHGPPRTGKAPRAYSLNPEDYVPLCWKCHWHYDRGPLTEYG